MQTYQKSTRKKTKRQQKLQVWPQLADAMLRCFRIESCTPRRSVFWREIVSFHI
jgi:hypothetical protein